MQGGWPLFKAPKSLPVLLAVAPVARFLQDLRVPVHANDHGHNARQCFTYT